jgi:hypothetical protein
LPAVLRTLIGLIVDMFEIQLQNHDVRRKRDDQ